MCIDPASTDRRIYGIMNARAVYARASCMRGDFMEWRKMRRFKQQVSEEDCIHILKTERRGVLALHGENGYPYAMPINFYYDEADGNIYFHGAKEGTKAELLEADPRVSFCVCNQGFIREGEWAYNATSVIVRGRISIVEDREKAERICRSLGLKYYPTPEGVEKELRMAFARTRVTCLQIDYMTGKLVNES